MREKRFLAVASLALMMMSSSGCGTRPVEEPKPQFNMGSGAIIGGVLGAAAGLAMGDANAFMAGAALGAGVGAASGAMWENRYKLLEKNLSASGVKLQQLRDEKDIANGIMFDAPMETFFEENSTVLLDTAVPVLKQIAMQAVTQNLQVDLSGNGLVEQTMAAYLQGAGLSSKNIIMSNQMAAGVNCAGPNNESLTTTLAKTGLQFALKQIAANM